MLHFCDTTLKPRAKIKQQEALATVWKFKQCKDSMAQTALEGRWFCCY